MEKYENGKIYKVVNTIVNMIYIGSTVQTLALRMGDHRYKCKSGKTSKLYIHMNKIGIEHFKILLIKNSSCNSKEELEAEEFDEMKKYDSNVLLNENVVYKKRSDDHIEKVASAQRGDKSVFLKYGSIFLNSRTVDGYCCDAWCFSYKSPKAKRFSFSIKKYGYEGARNLALEKQKEIYPDIEI
jgi:hypothetical protein